MINNIKQLKIWKNLQSDNSFFCIIDSVNPLLDFELLDNKIEEGEKIEPEHFLPIVPTVILNGTSGIAVGFATNILNRNPKDVVDACISWSRRHKVWHTCRNILANIRPERNRQSKTPCASRNIAKH